MIKNAKITSTQIGNGDRGPSFWIHVDYGNSGGQGFGGYRLGGKFTDYVLMGIINAVGVESWEDLKGRPVRVETDSDNEYGGTIVKIGHYLEDRWFDPSKYGASE